MNFYMEMDELLLLTKHSRVLASVNLEELKESCISDEFRDISLVKIFQGEEEFIHLSKLIKTINLFFKYDIVLYDDLLNFLIRDYVLKLQHNDVILEKVIYPVMMDIKKKLLSVGLNNYLFTGNTDHLQPYDIFRSVELLDNTYKLFNEQDFTSEVIAKGLSLLTTPEEIEKMLHHLPLYSFYVYHKDLISESIIRDNVVLLNYNIHMIEGTHNCVIFENTNRYSHVKRGNVVWYKVCHNEAAKNGSLTCLKYLYEKEGTKICDKMTINYAAMYGHLDCIKYLHKNGFPWSEWVSFYSSYSGHLDSLKYIHENGCPWDEHTCSNAAQNGHLDCLKYAHENGCPWNERTCSNAVKYNHLDCLKYAHENGCPWVDHICNYSAAYGNLDCLKYIHENGGSLTWNEDTCDNAAKNGNLECLKYLHDNGCPWNERTCMFATSNNNLECLKYLHENGCPWDENTCHYASTNGHLDCLKYAHENGCPWNEGTYDTAFMNDSLDCLKYFHQNERSWYKWFNHLFSFSLLYSYLHVWFPLDLHARIE